MKNDLVRGIQLIRFGLGFKGNIACMILFFFLGLAAECVQIFFGSSISSMMSMDLGAVFLTCSAMFPAQLVISMDVGVLAQSSGYKKKIQTSIPTLMMGVSSLFVMTLVVILRLIGAGMRPETYALQVQGIIFFTIFEILIILYSAIIYKFFVLSVLLLYFLMMIMGIFNGFIMGNGQYNIASLIMGRFGLESWNVALCIVCCYGFVIAAIALQYFISVLLYKKPLSKLAFGAAMKKL